MEIVTDSTATIQKPGQQKTQALIGQAGKVHTNTYPVSWGCRIYRLPLYRGVLKKILKLRLPVGCG